MTKKCTSTTIGRWLALCAAFILTTAVAADRSDAEEIYYGIRTDGKLMGYLEFRITPGGETEPLTVIESTLFAKLSLLGQDFDILIRDRYRIDPATGRVRFFDNTITHGANEMGFSAEIDNEGARFFQKNGGATKVTPLPPKVIVRAPIEFGCFLRDLTTDGAEKSYSMYDFTDGNVHEVTIRRLATETLTLAAGKRESVVFDWVDRAAGIHRRLWLDPSGGRLVRSHLPNGSILVLADPSVTGQIKRAELDDSLFARVDVRIPKIQSLTYLKVKGTLTTIGEQVTIESLNQPGQKFTGTVDVNRIDGVFEITPARYDGADAPPFPPGFGGDESLKKFLAPADRIESDDRELAERAATVTRGAADSWDAAKRLASWVAGNVTYSIPGGSARETLQSRKGECGAQAALLTAFCRSVGIPARFATGCVYTPLYGGSFGQHAWTEIYMGKNAGWIAMDTTVREYGAVDAGHIRLGQRAGFRPERMEILDYRIAAARGTVIPADKRVFGHMEKIPWEIGKTYIFRCSYDGKLLGTDSFTIVAYDESGEEGVYHCRTRLNHKDRRIEGEWRITDRGRPIFYRIRGQSEKGKYSIECDFLTDRVHYRLTNDGEPQNIASPWKEAAFLVDNNNLSLFAFLFSSLPIEVDRKQAFNAFHVTSRGAFPSSITVKKRMPGCWVCSLKLFGIAIELWIDDQGRVVKQTESDGRLVIELVEDF
jgi:transglutaminase-like putative cysteine protease